MLYDQVTQEKSVFACVILPFQPKVKSQFNQPLHSQSLAPNHLYFSKVTFMPHVIFSRTWGKTQRKLSKREAFLKCLAWYQTAEIRIQSSSSLLKGLLTDVSGILLIFFQLPTQETGFIVFEYIDNIYSRKILFFNLAYNSNYHSRKIWQT